MKTIQSLEADLKRFKDDKINERKKQKEINEYLLRNMMRVNPCGQPSHSTNKCTKGYHRKTTSSSNEEGR